MRDSRPLFGVNRPAQTLIAETPVHLSICAIAVNCDDGAFESAKPGNALLSRWGMLAAEITNKIRSAL